jgi:hypothetical protein
MNSAVKLLQDPKQGGGLPSLQVRQRDGSDCDTCSSSLLCILQLIAIRMSITLIGCASYLFYTGDPNPILGPPEVRKLLALRGFIGFFGLVGM